MPSICTAVGILRTSPSMVIPFSTVAKVGRDELAEAVVELVAQPSWRAAAAPEPVLGDAPGDTPEPEV